MLTVPKSTELENNKIKLGIRTFSFQKIGTESVNDAYETF